MERKEIIIILLIILIILYYISIKKENLFDVSGDAITTEALINVLGFANKITSIDPSNNSLFNNINVSGTIIGNLTGNVTGKHFGDVSGNVYGKHFGDVNGNVYGKHFGDVSGNVYGKHFGDVSGNVTGNVTNKLYTDNSNNVIANVNKLCVGSTCLTEDDLLRLFSSSRRLAGYALDGDGTTVPLYEGKYELQIGSTTTTIYDIRFAYWTQDKWDVVYVNRGWKITFYIEPSMNSQSNNICIDNSYIDTSGNPYVNVKIIIWSSGDWKNNSSLPDASGAYGNTGKYWQGNSYNSNTVNDNYYPVTYNLDSRNNITINNNNAYKYSAGPEIPYTYYLDLAGLANNITSYKAEWVGPYKPIPTNDSTKIKSPIN